MNKNKPLKCLFNNNLRIKYFKINVTFKLQYERKYMNIIVNKQLDKMKKLSHYFILTVSW